jgi:hypothetical protein
LEWVLDTDSLSGGAIKRPGLWSGRVYRFRLPVTKNQA